MLIHSGATIAADVLGAESFVDQVRSVFCDGSGTGLQDPASSGVASIGRSPPGALSAGVPGGATAICNSSLSVPDCPAAPEAPPALAELAVTVSDEL